VEAIYFLNRGKVRANNEDGILIDDLIVLGSMEEPKKIVGYFKKIVVSDGIGGLENGEVATKILLEHFKNSKIFSKDDIQKIIKKSASSFLPNSGCATAGIIFDVGIVFNVGDCRVYKKVDFFLNQLTKDHSLIQQLIDSGELSQEEVNDFEEKSVLTSAVMRDRNISIYQKDIKIKKGDIFLVCSDGIWGEFSIDELEECFNIDDIEVIGKNLFESLKKKNQKDNICFVIVKV